MKIIRSFLIVAITVIASTALHAQQQQVKAEIAKQAESTVPPPGTRPAPAPDVKTVLPGTIVVPENGVMASTSPLIRNEEGKPAGSLIVENQKILIGTAEMPKQPALINEPTIKPLPITAPAVLKAKENQ